MVRSEFVTFTGSDLLEACDNAKDAPRDAEGMPDRLPLIRALQAELGVLWSDLMGRLPAEKDVDLGQATEAGRRFRRDVILMWSKPQTFELRKATEPGDREAAARASLASRVRYQARDYLRNENRMMPQPRERWRQIQDAFAAWWRPYMGADGGLRIALAMRWELAASVGVPLPGVSDQTSLTTLGQRFGCLACDTVIAEDKISDRLSGGTHLAILHPSIVDELLSQPCDDEDSDTVTGAEASPDEISPDSVTK